eukprot:3290714-Karenia_brevis.AAC.1
MLSYPPARPPVIQMPTAPPAPRPVRVPSGSPGAPLPKRAKLPPHPPRRPPGPPPGQAEYMAWSGQARPQGARRVPGELPKPQPLQLPGRRNTPPVDATLRSSIIFNTGITFNTVTATIIQ